MRPVHAVPSPRRRRASPCPPPEGNALLMVLVFAVIFFVGICSYWFVVRSEHLQTASLTKDIQATAIGDGVCAQLVALVNRARWDERFYVKLAQKSGVTADGGSVSEYAFTHRDYPFRYGGEGWDEGEIKFFGSIKDLDAFNGAYRIYVEVIYYGHNVTMSWDKSYSEGLIGSLNREGTAFNKTLEMSETHDGAVTDRLLDRIKDIAREAAQSDLPPAASQALKALKATDSGTAKLGARISGAALPVLKARELKSALSRSTKALQEASKTENPTGSGTWTPVTESKRERRRQ